MICVECVNCGARNTTFLDDSTGNPSITCHACGQALSVPGNAVSEASAATVTGTDAATSESAAEPAQPQPWVVSEQDIVEQASHVEAPWVVSEQDIVLSSAPIGATQKAPATDSERARLAALRVSMVVDPNGWDDAMSAPVAIPSEERAVAAPPPIVEQASEEPAVVSNPIVETLATEAVAVGALSAPPPELVAAAREFVEHTAQRNVMDEVAEASEPPQHSTFPAAPAVAELQDAVSDSLPVAAPAEPSAEASSTEAATTSATEHSPQEPEVASQSPVLAVLRGEGGSGALAAALAATAPTPLITDKVQPEPAAAENVAAVAEAPALSPPNVSEAPVSTRPESPSSESRLLTDAPVARSLSVADVLPATPTRSRQYVVAAAGGLALLASFFVGRATKHAPGQAEIEAAAAALVASREAAQPKTESALAPTPAALPDTPAIPPPPEPDNSAATIVPTRASQRAAALGIKSTFDSKTAGRLIGEAAARASSCKRPGDNSAQATITVTFGPSGKVSGANVSGMQFSNLGVRNCIGQILKHVRVPAFSGSAVTVKKVVKI